jgi:D-ribose pyranose/furanose isomerase RbsD
MSTRLISFGILIFLMGSTSFGQSPWEQKLREELPLLGHRNWIVIADSAYPLQTALGVETLHTETDQLQVAKAVLDELAKTKHVKPIIYTDAELKYVAEKNAPGISAYREALNKVLQSRPVQALPHEQIINRLDEAGKTFKVLLIKTPLALPYTSIFLQLDCGYWNANAEKELREAMKSAGGK